MTRAPAIRASLHGARADGARRADDEHALARAHGRDALEEVERGVAPEQHGRGVLVGHAGGLRHEPSLGQRHELGVRARAARGARDLVAHRERRHALPDRLDRAREREAEHPPPRSAETDREARRDREAGREAARAHPRVTGADGRRDDAHEHLPAAGDGVGQLDDASDLGGTVAVDDDCAHCCSLRL
ncbi:hypothetical protein OVA14_07985 [Agrococcus sp. SL85]|nr:hypothetical protein [Agrococcus sp. SL85]WAC65320.1 hypothetical protein OVA14_07985 [Agrococcus sp. SL85]